MSRPSLPRVCVLLSSFNGERFIDRQISSILDQEGVQVSLFIRDDGSTDGTLQIVNSFVQRDPRVVLLSDPEIGPTGLPTKAFFRLFALVDLSDFDFVSLADQDDVWLPEKLARSTHALTTHDAAGYSSNLTCFYEDGGMRELRKSGPQRKLDYIFQGASAGCTYVIRPHLAREIALRFGTREAIDALPDKASHDWLIYAICRGSGERWFMDESSGILYRQHQRNVYGAQSGAAGLLWRFKLARSGWYFTQILFLDTVLSPTAAHQQIFAAIRRLAVLDRIWLAIHSQQFRRGRFQAGLLALYFLCAKRPE